MSSDAPAGRIRSFFTGISVATRIASAIVLISLLALIVATVIGLRTGTDLGEDLNDDRLIALRSSASRDVAAELSSLERTVDILRASPEAVQATTDISAAFDELLTAPLDDAEERVVELAEGYQEQYLTPLGEAGLDVDVRDVVAEDNDAAIYLQSTYSIDFDPLPRPAAIDDARDGSAWSAVHARIQPGYREIADELGLVDLMIVDADTGYVVYSVAKRPDLGVNVDVGSASGTIVSGLVDAVRDDPDGGVAVADFRRYTPSLLTPVAGMAGGVFDDAGDLVGVLVALFDSSELTRILTVDGEWDEGDYPPGGDTYLIGVDGTTRSEPRGFVEDRTAFLRAAEDAGSVDEDQLAIIEASDTTVLTLPAVDSTYAAAEEEDTSIDTRTSIAGLPVYSTIEPVPYEGVDWDVVAEADADAAEARIQDFRDLLVAGIAVYVIILAFLAVAWAGWAMRPVRAVSDRLGRFDPDEREPIEVPDRSPIEFHKLAASYDDASRALRKQRDELASARSERLQLMRRMLPTAVADRLAAGTAAAIDESPEATVVVLTLLGLAAEPADGSGNGSRRTVIEAAFAELDDVARHHGLEPIKVIGDEYYAACGHERPYIDHAPRAVAFAAEAFDVVSEHGVSDEGGAYMGVGIASGPVTVGLTGTNGLVYDVWGTTVRRADQLARRAGRGHVLVAGETVEKLPDTIVAAEVDAVTGQTAWDLDIDTVGDRV